MPTGGSASWLVPVDGITVLLFDPGAFALFALKTNARAIAKVIKTPIIVFFTNFHLPF